MNFGRNGNVFPLWVWHDELLPVHIPLVGSCIVEINAQQGVLKTQDRRTDPGPATASAGRLG